MNYEDDVRIAKITGKCKANAAIALILLENNSDSAFCIKEVIELLKGIEKDLDGIYN